MHSVLLGSQAEAICMHVGVANHTQKHNYKRVHVTLTSLCFFLTQIVLCTLSSKLSLLSRVTNLRKESRLRGVVDERGTTHNRVNLRVFCVLRSRSRLELPVVGRKEESQRTEGGEKRGQKNQLWLWWQCFCRCSSFFTCTFFYLQRQLNHQ